MPRRNSARRGHRRRGGGRAARSPKVGVRCLTPDKKHYRDKQAATVALDRIRARRRVDPDFPHVAGRAYECSCGAGWCLASSAEGEAPSIDVTRPWNRQWHEPRKDK